VKAEGTGGEREDDFIDNFNGSATIFYLGSFLFLGFYGLVQKH
jgi:hypothetical protein